MPLRALDGLSAELTLSLGVPLRGTPKLNRRLSPMPLRALDRLSRQSTGPLGRLRLSRFNALTGSRSIVTSLKPRVYGQSRFGFNALTGSRSIVTKSIYSMRNNILTYIGFNALTGSRSIVTDGNRHQNRQREVVSMPLRALDRLSRTCPVCPRCGAGRPTGVSMPLRALDRLSQESTRCYDRWEKGSVSMPLRALDRLSQEGRDRPSAPAREDWFQCPYGL